MDFIPLERFTMAARTDMFALSGEMPEWPRWYRPRRLGPLLPHTCPQCGTPLERIAVIV